MDHENSTEAIVDALNGIRVEAKRIADALEAHTLPPQKRYELNVVVPTPPADQETPAEEKEVRAEVEKPEDKLLRVAGDGDFEFWKAIANHYPEVTTGDFPPGAHFAFAEACEDALRVWLEWNHPAYADETEEEKETPTEEK